MLKTISRLRNRHFMLLDLIIFLFTPYIAMLLRLDNAKSISQYFPTIVLITFLYLIIKMLILYVMGIYRRYWMQASIDELALLIVTILIIGFFEIVFFTLVKNYSSLPQLPRSLPYLDTLITLIMVGFSRMTVRLALRHKDRENHKSSERTLIIGAGQAGISLAMDMQRNSYLGYNPVAFIDDDETKIGLRVRGIDIVGNRNDIKNVIKKYQIKRIVVAIPSASGRDIRKIHEECVDTGLKVHILPSLSEIMNGNVQTSNLREINIVDLLRREPIQTDTYEVAKFIAGKKVLITGAGGSIGSEICRQVLKFAPSTLILMGRGENSIFDINNELTRLLKHIDDINMQIFSVIADVRTISRLESIFNKYKPDIVFHAAAHKHVPLMEENPVEAITNNILGTRNLLDFAAKYGVENFVMISTDKAVNPTSIMGASKRTAEILVMKKASEIRKSYVCVRFGNVLGSRGSVVPIFKKQIEKGGPVIVTHPDVKRFFMTIPEAVQLVLQASVIGKGGEIFVLDMGDPIKIVDMAKDMIRLSGYKEFEIPIIYSGLRPGEKLFEELFVDGEKYNSTMHEKILIAANASEFIPKNIDKYMELFVECIDAEKECEIRTAFKQLIPEFSD